MRRRINPLDSMGIYCYNDTAKFNFLNSQIASNCRFTNTFETFVRITYRRRIHSTGVSHMLKREKLKAITARKGVTAGIYMVLRILIIISAVRALLRMDLQSFFLCLLSLVLLILPSILAHKLAIKLPSVLECIIMLFIFAAEILGEINNFYITVPYWDTMLHTINGFLCAAVGFALVDLMNRDDHFSFQLSPLYLAIVAFCFSMTVGVLWEFFEFAADSVVGFDMQKDAIVSGINSVMLDPTQTNTVVSISDIADVIIVHSDGTQEALGLGGYLDVGIHDTMEDLLVNLIGAIAFSVLGYFYLKKGVGRLAPQLMPQVLRQQETPGEKGQP